MSATATKINHCQRLLTKDEEKALPPLYSQDGKGLDAIAIVHYFNGPYDFWASEFDAEEGLFFGLARWRGNDPELGYTAVSELLDARFQFGTRIERDLHWTPKPLRECGVDR